jgi:Fe-S-cluster containining protein
VTDRPSLGCARCGACCESIPLEGLEHLQKNRADGKYDDDSRMAEDIDFMSEHWTALPDEPGHYACDQFDPVARLCRAQESKPPVCRDFPWYGGRGLPGYAVGLPPQCSYLLDVAPSQRPEGARPLIPIEVIR